MEKSDRQFDDVPAKREKTPLLIGETGPSGSGKTFSALRLATGIQRVTGGDIYGIDTEARRMLHYADMFKFRHLEFKAPFGPLDYLAAIEHCAKKGAGVVIVDSMSHEHEGPGGVLELHESELKRLAGDDKGKRDRMNFLAWQKPKSERRRMINTILQLPIHFIFCFRAKEKMKPKGGGDDGKSPLQLGWMPIAGEEFVYEMTCNLLLYPACGGVPVWEPTEAGEKQMIKLPKPFVGLFADNVPLSEDIGESLARWAAGDKVPGIPTVSPMPAPVERAVRLIAFLQQDGQATEAELLALFKGQKGSPTLAQLKALRGEGLMKLVEAGIHAIEAKYDLAALGA